MTITGGTGTVVVVVANVVVAVPADVVVVAGRVDVVEVDVVVAGTDVVVVDREAMAVVVVAGVVGGSVSRAASGSLVPQAAAASTRIVSIPRRLRIAPALIGD
jgi:hypothetical protein